MNFAVLDFETTGDQSSDQIIEVGLVIVKNGEITEVFSSLVNPEMEIPSFITRLTGITDEMVAAAPSIEQIAEKIAPYLQDTIIVAHNAQFDIKFLQKMLSAAGFLPFSGRVLDTVKFLQLLFPTLSSVKLSVVSSIWGIAHEAPHRAESDALATADIWLRCLERMNSFPLLLLQRLSNLFEDYADDFFWFIQEMRQKKENQTGLDLENSRYFRQFVINVNDWGEEKSQSEQKVIINETFTSTLESMKNSFQQVFPGYVDRASQNEMINEVWSALQEHHHLLVEAGTGTGKSLGYLIPALFYSVTENQKIVISTHTINLQEQLRERDIPLLQQVFPYPFQASILKGRNHYLCLRKFEHKINNNDYDNSAEHRLTAGQMLVWLSETKHGEDEELHFRHRGKEFWQSVASDTDSCLNRACPWFKKCFYHRIKYQANQSDIVITNHSLLFTDIQADNRLLPSYQQLIVDEAHHFEDVASKHLGIEVHYSAIVNTLIWLMKDSKNGHLPMLRHRLHQFDENERAMEWMQQIDALYPKIIMIKETWDEFCQQLYDVLPENIHDDSEKAQQVQRIKSEALPTEWDQLLVLEDNFYIQCTELIKIMEKLASQISAELDDFSLLSTLTDLSGSIKELHSFRDRVRSFMKQSEQTNVYWLEGNATYRSKSLLMVSSPIDVSPMLRQYFFETKNSVILTSATLSVKKSFQYVMEQLGLDRMEPEKVKAIQLESPFNYRDQALVCIPKDFPSVKNASSNQQFVHSLVNSIKEVATATHGRMMVLFTSNKMLKQVYPLLKNELIPASIQVLGQGVDSSNRSKLVTLFQQHPASV
ncbi:MAG: ATP-dependent DNA helicase DinG, partial [Paenibacillus sp. RIFOXYA1_FULL_44_5]